MGKDQTCPHCGAKYPGVATVCWLCHGRIDPNVRPPALPGARGKVTEKDSRLTKLVLGGIGLALLAGGLSLPLLVILIIAAIITLFRGGSGDLSAKMFAAKLANTLLIMAGLTVAGFVAFFIVCLAKFTR